MKEAERIRSIGASLLDGPGDSSSVDRAAQLLKLASEIENQEAQAAKYAAEEQKLKDDLSTSTSARKFNERKAYITILAPLFTTVILAGTLVLQSYQFKEQRKDVAAAAQRQLDAAEDVRWNEAIKVLAGDKQISPAGVLLATFSQSPRYRERAYDMGQQLLNKSTSAEEFSSVFENVFEPVSWSNLKWILNAARSEQSVNERLINKTWVSEKKKNDLTLLNEAERTTWDLIDKEGKLLGVKVGQLFKGPRPAGIVALDVSATGFWYCDWKGVDLRGADLTGIYWYRMDLDGADLSGITRFQGAGVPGSPWWNAAKTSPQLFDYLSEGFPYNPDTLYGSNGRQISESDYKEAVAKLKKASSIP